ncbi:hypothetical protein Tco_0572588 [Tanacetum coccineum]
MLKEIKFQKHVNVARQNLLRAAVTVNAARPIATADPKRTMNAANQMSQYTTQTHSISNPETELEAKGIIDSGCSRHMTGNKSFLSDYVKIDGGFVAFGGDS